MDDDDDAYDEKRIFLIFTYHFSLLLFCFVFELREPGFINRDQIPGTDQNQKHHKKSFAHDDKLEIITHRPHRPHRFYLSIYLSPIYPPPPTIIIYNHGSKRTLATLTSLRPPNLH